MGHYFRVQFDGPRPTNGPNDPEGWAYDSSVMRKQRCWDVFKHDESHCTVM